MVRKLVKFYHSSFRIGRGGGDSPDSIGLKPESTIISAARKDYRKMENGKQRNAENRRKEKWKTHSSQNVTVLNTVTLLFLKTPQKTQNAAAASASQVVVVVALLISSSPSLLNSEWNRLGLHRRGDDVSRDSS